MKNYLFDTALTELADSASQIAILIAVSGYESRATYLCSRFRDDAGLSRSLKTLILGFSEHREEPGRKRNDQWYQDAGWKIDIPQSDNAIDALEVVYQYLDRVMDGAGDLPVSVHLDYSSMPRSWYCSFAEKIPQRLRVKDQLVMWYCHAQYTDAQLPTAGVDDFVRYAGKPSLAAVSRTHLVGLGFDSVRSSAIKMVLDPKSLVVFYGQSDAFPEYRDRVLRENDHMIVRASTVLPLPTDDFVRSYSQLNYLIRDLARGGDVIVVPDGPKPLVLASSYIVAQRSIPGVVCIHVKRRRDSSAPLPDIGGVGVPVGFSISGKR